MADLYEGKLKFSFPADWHAIKYDETDWHRIQMKSQLKAMDVLACDAKQQHWWIEIKDCAGFETDNLPRLAQVESQAILDTRLWLKQQGLQSEISVQRNKPFIVDEIIAKLRDTLTALAIAQRMGALELVNYQVIDSRAPSLNIVLLLTWNKPDFKRLALRLQQKLNQALLPYGLHGFVVNEQNLADSGINCQISRHQA